MTSQSIRQQTHRGGRSWTTVVYPQLRDVPRDQWLQTLRRARTTQFDLLERIAIIGALGLSAWALEHVDDDSVGMLAGGLLRYVLALALLACLIAPLLLRRTRRGLDSELTNLPGGMKCRDHSSAVSQARDSQC